MTKKYRVPSSAMVLKITGILDPRVFDWDAKKIVNENARKSSSHVFPYISTSWSRY
jgi:hypothetical protein